MTTTLSDLTAGQQVTLQGERGSRDLSQAWTVETVTPHGVIFRRDADGRRGMLPAETGSLTWMSGTKLVTLMQHVTVQR